MHQNTWRAFGVAPSALRAHAPPPPPPPPPHGVGLQRLRPTATPTLFIRLRFPSQLSRERPARGCVDNITFTFPAWPHPNHPLSSDWMYDVANIYYQRALNYRCRTDDPSLAAIFFVPVFNTEMAPHPSSFCAEKPRGAAEHHVVFYERLRAQTGDAFTRRGGADHFFVNPRPGAGYFESHPVCELNLLDARLGASQLLSIEQRPSREARDKTFTYFADPKFVSVPYPSWVRLPTVRSAMSEQHAPWRSHHHRPLRVAAVFGLTVGSPTASELRKRLLTYCVEWNAKSESSCKSVGPRGLLPSGRPIPPEQHPLGSFNSIAAATYWNATFCLMPGGDSVTRKATMDALLLGCIPVLFHKGQVSQWYWHWGDWVKNGTYFIDVNDVLMNRTDPIEELVSLSQARVKSMRQSLAANAHRMHYALKEGGGPRGKEDASSSSSGGGGEVEAEDAFEITLRAVRNRTAARASGRLKDTAGRHREGRGAAPPLCEPQHNVQCGGGAVPRLNGRARSNQLRRQCECAVASTAAADTRGGYSRAVHRPLQELRQVQTGLLLAYARPMHVAL